MYLQRSFVDTKSSKEETKQIIISVYAFLSGFVFFEPSFAEIFFISTVPFLLFSIKFDYKTIIFGIILLLSLTASFLVGNFLGWSSLSYSIRYTIIDFYLVLLFLVFISVINQIENKDSLMNSLMKYWTISAFINIFSCFFATATGVTNFGGVNVISFGIRFQGFFKDPNVLGPFLAIPLAFWFEKYLKSQRKNISYLFISLILILGVVMTFSRAAWLNIFFTIFILLLLNFRRISVKEYFRMISFVFLIMLLLALLIISDIEILGYRLSAFLLNRLGLQSYDQDRFESQKAFVKGIEESLFFGVGPGNYSLISPMAAHSLYFRMLGERGLCGLLVLLIIILVSLKNFWKMRKSYSFLFAGLVGTLINSFFIDSWHWRHLWILFAIGFSQSERHNRLE